MADEATADEHREGAAANETPNEQPNDDAGAGGKTQILADLATERDKRQSLEQQFTSLKDGLAQALLDSRAFSQALAKVDATDPAAIAGAVTQFVEANPRFKTTPLRSPGSKDAGAGGTHAAGFTMDDLLRGRQ